MRAYATRVLATIVLVVSLLAPFAGGWAMALGLADGRFVVICTGDGLQTIYIDENGDATHLSKDSVACVLNTAMDTASSSQIEPLSDQLLLVRGSPLKTQSLRVTDTYLAPPPRAPPVI